MMNRLLSILLFALTLCTARAQTTVTWLTNATGLQSLPPASTRQVVAVGNDSAGWAMWHWNSASTASTNSTTVKYTGLTAGRWIQSPITVSDATSTGGGKVKTDTTVADPVVYLSSTVDDLLATATAPKWDQPFKVTSSGLVSTIGPGTILDAEGNAIVVAGNTVTNIASVTNFLVVTLSDLTVRSVRRAYHSGCVPVATLIAGASSITTTSQPATFRLPSDPLSRFKAKLKAGQLVRVAVLGTSLMNMYDTWSGGTNVAFRNLLFSTTYSSRGYNVTNAANVTQLDYSQGSSGPHLSFAMLGRGVAQPTNQYTADTQGLGIVQGQGTAGQATAVVPVQDSPLVVASDLVIVDTYNYGYALLSYIEVQLRRAAEAGADIIVIGSGPSTANTSFRFDQGPGIAAMCRAHGWAMCDINAFERAALDGGDTSYYVDGVHQSYSGNGFWAARMRDILNDYVQEPVRAYNARWNTVTVGELTSTYAQLMPEVGDVLLNSVLTDGSTSQAAISTASGTINPVVLFGGKVGTNCITILNPGQYAIYGHPMARAWDLLVEINPTVTYDFAVKREAGATTIKTFSSTFSSAGFGKSVQSIELFTPVEIATTYASGMSASWIGYTAGAFANTQFRIVNTSATEPLRIVAPVAHTVRYRDVENREWNRGPTGTWLEESGYYSGGNFKVLGNDSVGASARIGYHGRGIVVLLQISAAGGLASLVHDGATVTTDTYSAGGTNYKYYLAAPDVEAAGGRWDVASRDHELQINLTGVGSGGTPATGLRRLTIVAGYIIQ